VAAVPDSGASVNLSERDLSALRFAAKFIRGYEDSLGGDGIVGRREGEATSDVLAAIVMRAERDA
jgi:hypothetical protein